MKKEHLINDLSELIELCDASEEAKRDASINFLKKFTGFDSAQYFHETHLYSDNGQRVFIPRHTHVFGGLSAEAEKRLILHSKDDGILQHVCSQFWGALTEINTKEMDSTSYASPFFLQCVELEIAGDTLYSFYWYQNKVYLLELYLSEFDSEFNREDVALYQLVHPFAMMILANRRYHKFGFLSECGKYELQDGFAKDELQQIGIPRIQNLSKSEEFSIGSVKIKAIPVYFAPYESKVVLLVCMDQNEKELIVAPDTHVSLISHSEKNPQEAVYGLYEGSRELRRFNILCGLTAKDIPNYVSSRLALYALIAQEANTEEFVALQKLSSKIIET